MKYENKLVRDVIKCKGNYNDHVGIEIETEGDSLPQVFSHYWKSEADGSLRGESWEYVLNNPTPYVEVGAALEEMQEQWHEAGSVIKDSPNAGVHVHINVSDLTVTQLYNYISLYLVVENILINQCGVHRVGNLFCLRAIDAEYLLDVIEDSIREADLKLFHTDDLRYASINLKALGDYGSIEFRAWRADGDLKAIQWWVDLLMHLKGMARKIQSPSQIVADVSMMSPKGFFQNILGDFNKDIRWLPEYEQGVLDSVRRVQQFAFQGDW